ncbi:MAG: thiol protease/hemagglutinin PrtT [Bacteroidales bacterium]|nr:thiol protease/hemagglutinin PrtT [Bacteroidales bacterium]
MKKFWVAAMLALVCGVISAAPATLEQTRVVASNFYQNAVAQTLDAPQLVYTATVSVRGENTACFHVYNVGRGFVIVSADDRVKPVLGYSSEGCFNPQDIPFGLQDLLQGYTREISEIMQQVSVPDAQLKAEWQSLLDGTFRPVRSGRSVPALLDDATGINNWQQNNGYNYYCPAEPNGPAGKCYVGCCALSMGQVMHYWRHPAQGTGSHSYECNHSAHLQGQYGDYGILSANFGTTTYDYNNMPNHLTSSTPSSQILPIAKLLYHAGVSIEMWYGSQGSMGFHADIADALETYFKYDECLTLWKNSYSGDWEALLKEDLDLGRPIIYCAYTDGGAGHEFVCDGYDANNYFHFNMGWGGSYNGFYAIGNLNAQYNFSSSHGAVAHIRPLAGGTEGVDENGMRLVVYPNPVDDQLVVECEGAQEVFLYDMMGQKVAEVRETAEKCSINLSGLASGTYFVKVVGTHGTSVRKVLKR